jgi:hypothetical protein
MGVALVALVVVAAAGAEAPPSAPSPQSPRVLTPAEVQAGLAARLERMRTRRATRPPCPHVPGGR